MAITQKSDAHRPGTTWTIVCQLNPESDVALLAGGVLFGKGACPCTDLLHDE